MQQHSCLTLKAVTPKILCGGKKQPSFPCQIILLCATKSEHSKTLCEKSAKNVANQEGINYVFVSISEHFQGYCNFVFAKMPVFG